MSEDEKELLAAFGELVPENQIHALAYARTACAAQENTRKAVYMKLGAAPDWEIPAGDQRERGYHGISAH
jgi:hypothetical protein